MRAGSGSSVRSNRPRPVCTSSLPRRATAAGRCRGRLGIVRDLRAHRKAQQELGLRLGLGQIPDNAPLFTNLEGGRRSPNAMTKEWARTAAQLKLPRVNFHALRHTHASQLIAAGMDVLTISRRLGHGSPTIPLGIYGHLSRTSKPPGSWSGLSVA